MRIGIDVSQIVYEGGVGEYVKDLVEGLLKVDTKNDYTLFFSSLRRDIKSQISNFQSINKMVKIKTFRFPPTLLDFLWNRLHILPIEWLIGDIDVFLASDWTQPPTKAKKMTILYDLLVYKYPQEMHRKIVAVQRRRLAWVKKECDKIICISESTKKDAMEILGVEEEKLKVVYPGRVAR